MVCVAGIKIFVEIHTTCHVKLLVWIDLSPPPTRPCQKINTFTLELKRTKTYSTSRKQGVQKYDKRIPQIFRNMFMMRNLFQTGMYDKKLNECKLRYILKKVKP